MAAPRRRRPLPLFTAEYLPSLTIFSQRFFRDLYDRLKGQFVIVLDDYHDVPASSNFHEVARIAVRELPERGRIIVTSRAKPPLTMARLRANRAIHLLGGADLRLTIDEARGLARSVTDKPFAPAQIQALNEKTDGWAAGLVLMIEQKQSDLALHSQPVVESPQEIFDYFARELFAKSDRETRNVLLQTAFFHRFTSAMAAELTGLKQAGDIVDNLARENYFTMKHDAAEPAYRYHALFRDFLLSEANRSFSAKQRVDILRNAAALLRNAGQVEDAVELLQKAQDWDSLAAVVETAAPAMAQQGRYQTLDEWLKTLPEEIFSSRPWLIFWRGCCRMPFSLAVARPDLEDAFKRFRELKDGTGAYLAYAAILRSYLHEYHDLRPLDKWIDLLGDLRSELPEFPSPEVEARVTGSVIITLVARRLDHPDLPLWVARGEDLAQTPLDLSLRVDVLVFVSFYYYWRGDFHKGLAVSESIREVVRSKEVGVLEQISALFQISRYEWLTGSPGKCFVTLTQCLEIADRTGVHCFDTQVFTEFVVAALSMGDLQSAADNIKKASLLFRETQLSRCDLAVYHFAAAWHAYLNGDYPLAHSHQELGLKPACEFGLHITEAVCHLMAAPILHRRKEHDLAREHVSRALEIARQSHAKFVEFMALLTEAELAFDSGAAQNALKSLREALAIGRQQGYVNTFTWRPPVMARLCAKALEAGIEVDYVQWLIRKRGLVPEAPPVEIEQWPWPIKVYTSGRFSLLVNGRPIAFGRKSQHKPVELLQFLIVFGGREVPEEHLTDHIWPDADGDQAQQALSTTLHRLRRLLGYEEAVLRQEKKLSLNSRLCWVDIWAMERHLGRAEAAISQAHRNGKMWPEVSASVEKALALYHGPLLGNEGLPYAAALADRVRRRMLRALSDLGKHWENNGQWQSAAQCYERGLEVNPCAEPFYRQLMVSHQKLGDRSAVVATYERCRQTLRSMMNAAPSPETEALYKFIKVA